MFFLLVPSRALLVSRRFLIARKTFKGAGFGQGVIELKSSLVSVYSYNQSLFIHDKLGRE